MLALRSFQSKLFVAYALFILFIALIVSIPMYFYLHRDIEKNISVSVEQVVAGISDNLDLYGLQYANMTKQLYLASDNTGTPPIQYLDIINASPSEIDRFKARLAIEYFMNLNLEIFPDVRRISIFRENGEYISNLQSGNDVRSALADGGYDQVRAARGASLVRYHDHDYWSDRGTTAIFSLSRLLSLNDTEQGYFEIQIPASTVLSSAKLQSLPEGELWILSDSEIYSPVSDAEVTKEKAHVLRQLVRNFAYRSEEMAAKQMDRDYYVIAKSEQTGLYVVYSSLGKTLFAPLNTFRNVMIVSVLLLILLSLFIFYLLTKTLTSPLRNLKKVIDAVDLGEHFVRMENKYQMDEIELLNRSFRRMNERLQNSLLETIRFRTLQLRTHFEKLQSQINPHFLFNMLGVITRLSEKEGVPGIADIGRKLADFLRYTTNTDPPISNVKKEMKCVEDYLELMKSRYLHRLRYAIDIPQEMYAIPVPVLTLQPLVENCIQHGFHARTQELAILIIGSCSPNGEWEILIQDNGVGFDLQTIQKLKHNIETYFERIDHAGHDLSIGGMGLISSFVRLKYLYKNQIHLSFGNNPDSGAFVRIAGTVSKLEEGKDEDSHS